jgi:aryl-alcohol dehydrogenase-like predicted oxidoreductase
MPREVSIEALRYTERMRSRRLGRSDIEVPLITLGAWAIGGWNWGGSDDGEAVYAIQAAIDCGMNAIDTAPVYGFGHSERVVGRALAGRRDRAIVMTKVGLRWDDDEGDFYFETNDRDGRKVSVRKNGRAASVKWEVERSLERLGVETIDLVQVHWPDPKTPIAETMGALLDLRSRGKVRAIGVSNFSVELMKAAQTALGDVPLASDQPKYSLVARDIEREILPFARSNGIGVVVYSPLEQGLLTGAVTKERSFPSTDGRRKRWTFTPENRRRVNEVLSRVVRPIASKHSAAIGQVVLAWTVAQPGVTSAIAGVRTRDQARENAAAGELELAPEELASIRAAFEALQLEPQVAPAGSRIKRLVKRMLGR